jgi:hypothetical protein
LISFLIIDFVGIADSAVDSYSEAAVDLVVDLVVEA